MVKPFLIGLVAGFVVAHVVPLRLSAQPSGGSAARPPGMTGGGPGWMNNPGT